MLSNRPYLLRAFYQWIVDSACTPILVLDANHPHCQIPRDYAEGGEIVFNISSMAVRDLNITNESIAFKASFSGVVHLISASVQAVLAIYAEENGEGIFFDAEEAYANEEMAPMPGVVSSMESPAVDMVPQDAGKAKPILRLVE